MVKYSATSVSNLTDVAIKEIEQWENRPLEKRYSVLFIDALSIKIRRERVGNESAYIIIGINGEGYREILDYNSKWSERRLKGFLAAREKIIQLFEERY